MTHPPIIGLYSSVPRSGKTTVAQQLAYHGYITVSYAEPLRRVTHHILAELGISTSRIDNYLKHDKEAVIPELGVSARHILRTLGTEWGRDCIHPEIWVRCWRAQASSYLKRGFLIVVDDVRFPNEIQPIRDLGGVLWRITRPSLTTPTHQHASDSALDHQSFDHELLNDSTLEHLEAQTTQALRSCTALDHP